MKMKRRTFVGLIAVLVLLVVAWRVVSGPKKPGPVPVGEITALPTGEGWINLFDAAHQGGWENINDDVELFAFEDDEMHLFGDSLGKLRYVGYTAEELGDYELHAEVKLTPGANSGIFIRTIPNEKIYRGFEIQVQDDYGTPPNVNTSGAIYDVVSPMHNMAFPVGQWNSYDIRVQGDKVRVIMNGWLVIQSDFEKMITPLGKFEVAYKDMQKVGLLAFQDHGGEVWFRNVVMRKL